MPALDPFAAPKKLISGVGPAVGVAIAKRLFSGEGLVDAKKLVPLLGGPVVGPVDAKGFICGFGGPMA